MTEFRLGAGSATIMLASMLAVSHHSALLTLSAMPRYLQGAGGVSSTASISEQTIARTDPPVGCSRRIQGLVETLESGNPVRDVLEFSKLRGSGVAEPWMEELRRLGVKEALFRIRLPFGKGAPSAHIVGQIEYLREYGRRSTAVTDPEELRRIRTSGLEGDLRDVAARRAVEYARGESEGCCEYIVQLFEDECLPQLFGMEDPTTVDVEQEYEYGTAPAGAASLKALLDSGGDVNKPDECGHMPLVAAAALRDLDTVRMLLGRGADVNSRNIDGTTPLMAASSRGESSIVRTLLSAGANVKLRNRNGDTALDLALDSDHAKVAKMIRRAAARQ